MLFLIVLVGFLLRIVGLNWDANMHLHPDERFLTMVSTAMKLPVSFFQYVDPLTSPMNPKNIGFPFYVYGLFPVLLNKFMALVFHNDTYNMIALQGRVLSAAIDSFTIITIYYIVREFERRYHLHASVKLWAAFFYAIAVLPIQLSHFFTVDMFLSAFMMLSYLMILKNKPFAAGLFFGCAIGSKITAIYILPLLVVTYIVIHKKNLKQILAGGLIMIVVSYVSLRLINPYMFAFSNVLNPTISQNFIHNLTELKNLENREAWFPPMVQWFTKIPVLFSLENIFFFGAGPAMCFFILLGVWKITTQHKKHTLLLLSGIFTFLFFIYQSVQIVQTLRYFIFLYPFFAIAAGLGFAEYFFVHRTRLVTVIGVILILIWPLMFLQIYFRDHSRIAASKWIYGNIPAGAVIAYEHWDDPLPLPLEGIQNPGRYTLVEMPVFDPDTSEKIQNIYSRLQRSQYYILSSNRGWGSIPTVPHRYPLMSKFYANLFAGKTNYKKIAEFTSYPGFPDDWAEEAFTVYDHPHVLIYKKQ